MGKFDHECELCGMETRTICNGALRLCRECAEKRLYELRSNDYTSERTYKDLDDCALECGNYYNLVSLLYCIGNITGVNVEELVEALDAIYDGRGL